MTTSDNWLVIQESVDTPGRWIVDAFPDAQGAQRFFDWLHDPFDTEWRVTLVQGPGSQELARLTGGEA